MAADQTTVLKRVTGILNLQAPGTFSSTVASTNLDRHADEITQIVREGAIAIARAILSNPKHCHRNLFISGTPTALTHGGELPDMASEGDLIEIQKVAAGIYFVGISRDVQQVVTYRDNGDSFYGTSHTTAGSPISGYYAMHNGRFYFTGNAAQGYFPIVDRATVGSLIPDEYEDAWVTISAGLTPKEGDMSLPIAQYYAKLAQKNLAEIASMSVISMPLKFNERGNV